MGRLFWKIFFWYWIALILINIGQGWIINFYYEQIYENNEVVMRRQVHNIVDAFKNGDLESAQSLLQASHKGSSLPVYAADELGREFFGGSLPQNVHLSLRGALADDRRTYKEELMLPGGNKVTLIGLYRSRSDRYTIIWFGLCVTLFISTLVCYWLARYLSFPIQRLTKATCQIAKGNLDVRVGTLGRRDEIADLAQDFDRMADKVQKLLDSQKQLLQDISHELRSPLARLHVALALVQRKNSHDKIDFDRITKDLDRLDHLIDEVLTLSRLDTITYPVECVDLSKLIFNISEDCSIEAGTKGCSINVDAGTDLFVDGSHELLLRAIENILRNAIKFTADESLISVVAKRQGNSILVNVIDEGPGIPESSLNNIFEAFVRVDQSRPHNPGGYGVGLAIAKKAIDLHGGEVKAENNPRGGLTVTINIPFASQIFSLPSS